MVFKQKVGTLKKKRKMKFICDYVFPFVNTAQFSFVFDFKIYFHRFYMHRDWFSWDFQPRKQEHASH